MHQPLTIIEACNFIDEPTGGQLSFAKNLIHVLKYNIILVGTTKNKKLKIGKWTILTIDGIEYAFFPFMRSQQYGEKSIIPRRLKVYYQLNKYKNVIYSGISDNILIQAPEVLAIFVKFKIQNIIFRFPGVSNALSISRFPWARKLAPFYDSWVLPKVAKVSQIIAAADQTSIEQLEIRSKGLIQANRVIRFPTRTNQEIFKKMEPVKLRKELSLSLKDIYVLTCGRLIEFKGWRFLLDSFKLFSEVHKNSFFLFIGDGDDQQIITKYIATLGLNKNVIQLGHKDPLTIAKYLNAVDLFVMGSMQEGFSTTLVEAATCGVPCVVTDFSSAQEIIQEGINGFIVKERDIENFSFQMNEALQLDRSTLPTKNMSQYNLISLKNDFLFLIPS